MMEAAGRVAAGSVVNHNLAVSDRNSLTAVSAPQFAVALPA